MAAVEPGFEESLVSIKSMIPSELNRTEEVVRNIVVLKKGVLRNPVASLSCSPWFLTPGRGASESFIFVVSPLNDLMRDQMAKLNDFSCGSAV